MTDKTTGCSLLPWKEEIIATLDRNVNDRLINDRVNYETVLIDQPYFCKGVSRLFVHVLQLFVLLLLIQFHIIFAVDQRGIHAAWRGCGSV